MSFIDTIHEAFLWCRDVQHSWNPYNVTISRNRIVRRNEVHQILLCARCGTLKTRVMTPGGEMLRSSYSYPQGYLAKDQGRMTPTDRAMIRAINLKKQKD